MSILLNSNKLDKNNKCSFYLSKFISVQSYSVNLTLFALIIYNYFKVGIEECLHIEFEYNKSKYHLKDVIVGKIYFLLVRSGEILLRASQR